MCNLPDTCDTYENLLGNFSFQILFKASKNYIRVPLGVFAQTVSAGCVIQVTNINYYDNPTVILGGLFFQNFYSIYQNTYNKDGSLSAQATQIYINKESDLEASYIGDEMLPQGDNPFIYTPNVDD